MKYHLKKAILISAVSIACFFLLSHPFCAASELSKTGQTKSYLIGDDGTYQKGWAGVRFTDKGDDTITDNSTGLIWVKDGKSPGCADGATIIWKKAVDFCENLTYAGYSDWRLPNVRELLSLVDYSRSAPAINTTYFPNTALTDYWSSTTHALTTSQAWGVCYDYGRSFHFDKSETNYVRCVRGVR
ncbi:MAG: DUF1566 domain-containing protein [Candidatus Omnitrophica bacterium]|nr:DUF1566 domain-containing protein [Candidatus Omnitrophota bacterium]